MALETLKGVKEIGGFPVGKCEDDSFVQIIEDENAIAFKLQNGPIKEFGVNGCQVDTIIEAAKLILEGFNAKFPSAHNRNAIDDLADALMWLQRRKADRESRDVEGTSQV